MSRLSFYFGVAIASPLILSQCGKSSPPPGAGNVAIQFDEQIRPIIQDRCISCHHTGALMGDLNLENRALAFAERKDGPVIIPGKAEESPLFKVLTLPAADLKSMPPTGHKIEEAEVELIKLWINAGAPWPDGASGTIEPPAVLTTPAPGGVPS